MSAVTEPLVSAPQKTMIFSARREDLRLTKVPRYPVYGASGQKVNESIGEVVCFKQGRLEVPLDGDFVLEDGRTAPAAEVLEWLQHHRLLGDAHEGFFEVTMAAPAPSAAEMEALVSAAVALDTDRLAEIAAQEEAGWGREAILSVARGAIERVEEFKAQVDAEAAEKAAQASEEPKPAPKAKQDAGEPQA